MAVIRIWDQLDALHQCAQGNVAHYVFVASAGAYKTNKIEPALVEGDARKEAAGHVAVENYLVEQVRYTDHALPSSHEMCWTMSSGS